MSNGSSLPTRAALITLCVSLALVLFCGCAKQGVALMTMAPAAVEQHDMPPAPAIASEKEAAVDHLFACAQAEGEIPATTRRNAFAPSL